MYQVDEIWEDIQMKIYKLPSVFAAAFILVTPALCPGAEVDELKARVSALEERLASLEKSVAPLIAKAEAEQIRASRQDSETYTRDELRAIESLYQVANKKWRSKEAQNSLRTLVQKYDKANRTGCAILYLGQMSTGNEKIEHLKRAIEQFGDCFYGDGVQVGAYARFLLGHTYLESDKPEEAERLFKEIRENYSDAIDHRGNLLSGLIPE